jgi:hypothetical protein
VKKERKETPIEMPLSISDDLSHVLDMAVAGLPTDRQLLEPIDLIWSLLKMEGCQGREALRVATHSNFSSFEELVDMRRRTPFYSSTAMAVLRLKNGEIVCSNTMDSLLMSAKEVAGGGKTIDTGDLLRAEIQRESSLVMSLMHEAGFSRNTVPFMNEILKGIEARNLYTEKGVVEIPSPTKLEAGGLIDLGLARTFDLMEMDTEDVAVKPEWTMSVLSALAKNNLVCLTTSNEGDVELIVTDLANRLKKNGDVFDYSNVVLTDPGFLEEDPEGTIREAVEKAKGGILVLPSIADHIKNRGLRTAITRSKLSVITFAREGDWREAVRGQRILGKAEIIKLDLASKDEVERMYLSRLTIIEEELGEKMKLSISPESIREAVEVADRYMKSMPLGEAVMTLLQRSVLNLKIAVAGIGDLSDSRVIVDNQIDPIDIFVACEQMTGIEISPEDLEKYLNMEGSLRNRVVGQDSALEIVSNSVREAKAGLKDPEKPIGSFMFLGPSGVGKTELAKTLAEFLFGDENAIVQIDMSEYMEKHSAARLFGAPPGYVGYDEGGQLTEAVRRRPYSVINFDEIEKAHPDVWNALLQILNDGRLTDGQGRVIDFKYTIIIMTSNVGSEYYNPSLNLEKPEIDALVAEKVKETFRPEFLGRVNEKIVFNSLSKKVMSLIVEIQIGKLAKILKEKNIEIVVTKETKKKLAELGYSSEYGARPLLGIIRRQIKQPISKMILSKKVESGKIKIDIDAKGEMVFLTE